jgi:hypothetical protein
MKSLIVLLLLPTFSWAADPSPLCENLSRFACSPGTQKDGTGTIYGEEEVQARMDNVTAKVRKKIRERLKEEFAKPENSYFKQVAIASLGMKNSPECNSPSGQAVCEKNLVEGTSALMEKYSLKPLKTNVLAKKGNLKEMGQLYYQDTFQKVMEEVGQILKSELSSPAQEKKIGEKIFPATRALIVKKLQSLPIEDKQKKLMIEKVQNIRFTGTECTKLSPEGRPGLHSLLVPNAYYSPEANTFTYCNGFNILGDSEFAIVHTIAHELGHSIDPCNIARAPADLGFKYSPKKDRATHEKEYPIPNLISCLRSEKSVMAQPKPEAVPVGQLYPGTPGVGMGMAPPQTSAAANKNESPFCEGDQIGESFSDWLATEVLPDYIESNYKLTPEQYQIGYSNTFRATCDVSETETSQATAPDVHPDDDKRIDRIILVHPKVRAQMKCPPKHSEGIYCDPQQPWVQETSAQPQAPPSAPTLQFPPNGPKGSR